MKTIITTISLTFAILALTVSIFLKSLLGLFGLAALPVSKIQELYASQKVVETMKSRHNDKKANATKKFGKRTTKRLASATVAAATLGTIAVTATVATIEVADYCDEKESLQEDENILYGTANLFSFEDCVTQGKIETVEIINGLKTSSFNIISELLQSTSDHSIKAFNSAWDKAKGFIE